MLGSLLRTRRGRLTFLAVIGGGLLFGAIPLRAQLPPAAVSPPDVWPPAPATSPLPPAAGVPPAPAVPVLPTAPPAVPASNAAPFVPQPGMLIVDVQIRGNETVPLDKVMSYLRTRRDREFDPEVVQRDVRELLQSGMFQNVRTLTQPAAGGVVVVFEVFERPTIHGQPRFIGNRSLSDKALLKESGLKVNDALNVYSVKEARRKIEEFYRSKGFPHARVVILQGDEPQDREVVFEISEGTVERILDVNFVGNDPSLATDARLKTQIKSKPGFAWVIGGKLDTAKLDEDVERLTAYYRSLGYFQARVGRELLYSNSGQWVTVNFVIHEGPRYTVRQITLAGQEKYPEEELRAETELGSGDFFNLAQMDADVNALRDYYGSRGHIFADIEAEPVFLEEPGQLDIVYKIKEGDVFRVGEINIHIAGEYPHTRQSVVLNRLSLRPDDIIDIREVRASERRLKSSQLFENNPAEGTVPRIVIRPPELAEAAEALAEENDRSSTVRRGQDPEVPGQGGDAPPPPVSPSPSPPPAWSVPPPR